MTVDLDAMVRKSAHLDRQIDALQRKGERYEAGGDDGSWHPLFDLYHHDNHVFVDIELPGVPPSTVEVEPHERMVVVRGEKPSLKSLPNREEIVTARQYGPFSTQFALPDGYALQHLDQRMEHGVLHLRIALEPLSDEEPRS